MPTPTRPAVSADDVLDLWFGSLTGPEHYPQDKAATWFSKAPELDAMVRERFGEAIAQAGRGELDAWSASPRGLLALVILCDQLTRNAYRDTAEMYALDDKALALALHGLERGYDRTLSMVERMFLYMPLMHAEDAALQWRCVELFEALAAAAPPALEAIYGNGVSFARKHAVIVDRFGRFPHRNRILGRASSAEEEAFLQEPDSSF